MRRLLFLGILFVGTTIGFGTAQAQETYGERASLAAEALQGWYSQATGQWDRGIGGTNWWNSANALTALIDMMRATETDEYLDVIVTTFERNQSTNFLNNFYDDAQWWALAWVDAYDLTGDEHYLEMARTIFEDITGGWDEVCGGGVWWTRDRDYKNAITNELFLLLAVRLHLRTPEDTEYLDWAQREWDWFQSSGMINALNLVNDGLDANCENNSGQTWTYNQGVILAGLVDLYRATEDEALLEQATAIADAATARLITPEGILREPCEPSSCGADGTQFKGIFMRHLAYLHAETETDAYGDFILRNANSIWANNRNEDNQLGLMWAGPFDAADASRQSSALDALNAAVPLEELPEPEAYQGNLTYHAAVSVSDFCAEGDTLDVLTDGDAETKWCASEGAEITLELGSYYSVERVVVSADADYALEYATPNEMGTSDWVSYDDESVVTNALRVTVDKAGEIGEIEIYGATTEQPVNEANLALNRPTLGSSACSPSELPAQAVDGRADTKWCSGASTNIYLQVDLGEEQEVSRFIVRHAGSHGENSLWNTRDFEIQYSSDGRNDWTTIVEIEGNTENVTIHDIEPMPMRYVRLLVLNPQTAPDSRATRIYEFEVY